ncbi:MAG TPA: histidine kinase [Chitinophagaceae bacterium]
MKLRLPYYSSKDYLVLGLILLPVTLIINSTILGTRYFSSAGRFVLATFISGLAFTLYFMLCGKVAVLLKNRFPNEEQTGLKLSLMIASFLVMTGLFLLMLFKGYERISFFNYRFNENAFVWGYVGLGMVNIFLTFLFEGIARFESWKANLKETEQLKKSYRQSQLQALKSQVNPHFLFNSLNSLSSLISEEGNEAERFLDEMSKVYRYMLRNDDDQLVTLEQELKFLESYMHLLKARYGDALMLTIKIDDKARSTFIPPLSLQVLVENALTQNTISKADPLTICITCESRDAIIVKNKIQPRMITESGDFEAGLDNLVRKYELLNQPQVIIHESKTERSVRVPLINKEEVML